MGETLALSTNGAEHANSSTDSTASTASTAQDDQPPLAEPPDIGTHEKSACHHTLSAEQTADALGTDRDHGLSDEEAAARLNRDGRNAIKGAKGLSIWEIFLQQIANALTAVLIAVAVISYVIGDFVEGSVVVAVIVLNIVVG